MKRAIIIGAGPAGLTAAYELLQRTDILPVILEKSGEIGGISKTVNYKGNRMDMGPHRFFSKSDRVMQWWLHILPLQQGKEKSLTIHYQNKSRQLSCGSMSKGIGEAGDPDKVMLVVRRLTRIYFLRQFFAYPIQLSIDTLRKLGLVTTVRIVVSYLAARLFPRTPEKSLEDFIINKFGQTLYRLFFQDYTEKVWGVPCSEISAEWGAQRIKGVSLSKAIAHALKTMRPGNGKATDIGQKETETSLIEQFLYPKFGPGQLWEEVARQVEAKGGEIHRYQEVQSIGTKDQSVTAVTTLDTQTGETRSWEGDYFISTMPVQELIAGMGEKVPEEVQAVAAGLQYRDFINVGILLRQLSRPGGEPGSYEKLDLKDSWIYIQERDVKVGRLQIYNNWGPGMVADPATVWIGLEYFCNKTDAFWQQPDETIKQKAIAELERIGLARPEDVLDSTVERMEKTYPAYFGTYHAFDKIRAYTDQFANLFLVGRNGMHKYNNADHSMLTAMVAVDNIYAGVTSKANLWSINTEQDYHEEKQAVKSSAAPKPSRPRGIAAGFLNPSFPDFAWRNKGNRQWLVFAFAAFLGQFILFKFPYPYANYMPDSYSYLEAAYTNADVNMWPVAYSKFLRLLSVFTHSDVLVAGFQYFFLQGSTLLFLFTLLYFLQPGRVVRNILFVLVLFNPVPLYISNYISADALFIALSLCWCSSLLWILYQPRPWQIIVQAVLLLACFTVRYNAIYYPLVAALAFLLSRQRWQWKVGGIGLGTALVIFSLLWTSQKMQEVTGRRQFSAFGGWQLANNALYMYEHIPARERGPVPARFARLESMVRQHMDTLRKVKLTKEDSANNYFYLWSGRGPLIQYMLREWKKDSTTSYFRRWAAEGPLYMDYGLYLIGKYPLQFAKNFLFPNSIKYAVPPSEFLAVYNMGSDSVGQLAKEWFNYPSLKVKEHNKKDKEIIATSWVPVFSAMVNVLLVICLAGMLVFGGMKDKNNPLFRLTILVVSLWLVNMGFSVFASPIVLRYQVYPILLSFILSVLMIEYILQQDAGAPKTSLKQKLRT
jgi:protoporphyrinogen oxidase